MVTQGQRRKMYEVKLNNLLGTTATSEQVNRIRLAAVDLTNGADWDETVAWVRDGGKT